MRAREEVKKREKRVSSSPQKKFRGSFLSLYSFSLIYEKKKREIKERGSLLVLLCFQQSGAYFERGYYI